MPGLRRSIATCGIALSMSGCFTLIGVGVGGAVAAGKNGAVGVQQGYEPRTSVAKSMAVGGAIGLVLDVVLISLTIHDGQFGH
jgi:hypothetical protein